MSNVFLQFSFYNLFEVKVTDNCHLNENFEFIFEFSDICFHLTSHNV